MGIFYVGRVNNWSNGTKVLIHVPNFTGSIPYASGHTVQWFMQEYPLIVDQTYLYITTTFISAEDLNSFRSLGFEYIWQETVTYPSNTKIYISPTSYIGLWQTVGGDNGSFFYKDGVNIGAVPFGGRRLNSLPSTENGEYLWFEKDGSGNSIKGRTIGSGLNLTNYKAFWNQATPFVPSTDPFYPGGESDVGGGTGTFDGTSTSVDFSSLPSISAVDTGFIGLYNPSVSDLQSLANYLWSPLFDITTLKKLFTDPMECILGVSILPGPVPTGTSRNVIFGNIDTGISMPTVSSQYFNVDCGSLNIQEYWGAYLDYEPYTKAEIYLPFIGVHQIAIDEIMGKTVAIKYHVDALSGACCCEIKCGGSVLYTFVGSCSTPVPVTSKDWSPMISGIITMAASVGSMVASGGKTAPGAGGDLASAAVNSLKPSIEKSGAIGGGGGLMGGMKPVLILTRPRQALPTNQNEYTGYPSFVTRTLSDISGYTEIHSIRLSGIDGTDDEISEIEELLKGGVIF